MGFDISRWWTPPKSKDPWTAMTKGSTGGWAKPFAKPATLLPAAAALAAIPFTGGVSAGFIPAILGAAGAGIGAIQGATTGLWGKPSGGSALKGAGMGAVQGAGVGAIGSQFAPTAGNYTASYANPTNYNYAPYASSASEAGEIGGYGSYLSGAAGSGTVVPAGLPANFGTYGGAVNYGTGVGAGGSAGNTIGSMFSSAIPEAAAKTTGTSWLSNLTKGINPYQTAAGLGISAIPSLMGGETPQIPESQLFGNVTSRLLGGKGITEAGQLGQEALKNRLTSQFEPVPDEYYNASTRRLNESFDKAEENFAKQMQGLRPGSNIQNDSAYRQGLNKLQTDRSEQASAIAADLDYRREGDWLTRRSQDITTALGLDQQTFGDYLSLAQMDSQRLALNTGISMADAQAFKDIFGELGAMFMKRGIGVENPENVIQRMMSAIGR